MAQKIHMNQIHHSHHLNISSLIVFEVVQASRIHKKEGSFVVPQFSKDDQLAAYARVKAALDQVHRAVHLNPKAKMTTATLCVWNLEFNAIEENLSKSLVVTPSSGFG